MGKTQLDYSSLLLVLLILAAAAAGVKSSSTDQSTIQKDSYRRVEKLFAFGDSYVDTGNIRKSTGGSSWKFPYGITFPGKSTGRFSDGRILTDFVAKYLGVPSPLPYRVRKFVNNLSHYGVNFAYGGTGVFNTTSVNPKLSIQISFMEQLIQQGVYSKEQLSSSAALISVAGNDYTARIARNESLTPEALKNFTDVVVNETMVDILKVLSLGIPRVAITTLVPFGCMPALTAVSNFSTCTDVLNPILIYQRALLQNAASLINNNSNASSSIKVVVLDLYQGFSSIIQTPSNNSGFAQTLRPCCLGSAQGASCSSVDENGNRLYNLCDVPTSSFFWDTFHPTQAGWTAVASYLRPSFQQILLS